MKHFTKPYLCIFLSMYLGLYANAQLWKTQTSGTTNLLFGVYFTSSTNGWAVGLNGTILTTSNGGSTWSAQTSGTSNSLNSVYFTSSTQGWAVGNLGIILTTSNGGATWTTQTSGTSNSLTSIYFTSPTQGWAVGISGTILTTSNGGATWTTQTSGTGNNIERVYFTSSTQGWVVGFNGTILSTSNGGTTWTTQTSGTSTNLEGVYFTSSTQGWAVGWRNPSFSAIILTTSDGGTTWTAQSSGTSNYLYSVYFTSSTQGWAVGSSGTILTTNDGGNSWSSQSSGTTYDLHNVYFTSSTQGCAVGFNGTILSYSPNLWTGSTSSNWSTASNWSVGTVPISTDYVFIPAVSRLPVIGNSTFNAACYDLTINSSASLTINTFLQVNGDVTNNGTISGSGSIVLGGSTAQTISGNGTISNMNVNNSNGVTISSTSTTQTVTGTIIPSAGTLTTSNGNLILASSAGNNASIAQGSGTYLSGTVNVQRYVGNSTQWRMVGFPLNSATISEATLSGFYVSGYKAYTYNEGGDNGNYGSSGSTNAGWVQFTSGTIPSTKGILLSGGNIGNKINYTGTINTGTQTIPLSYTSGNTNKGWNLIANPFASAIDWNTIQPNNATNLDNAIYRYDPNSTAYASFVNGTNAGYQSNVIENGAGFFVHSTGATSITIQESDKTTSTPAASLMGIQTAINKSIIKLTLAKQGDQYADEVVMRWGVDPATDSFDGDYDAYDMGRAVGPDLSVIGNDQTVYSIFHGSALKTNDIENRTVLLGIKNMEEGTYQIGIQLLSAIANSNKAYLFDSYTNQYTLIDGNTNSYTFIATSDAKSQSNTIFSIVMNAKTTTDNNNTNYPVTLLNNPSTGNLFTLYSKNNYSQLQYQIIDNSGRALQTGLLSNVLKGSTHQINAGNTTQGSYFIKLTGDGNVLPVLKAIKN